MKITIYELIGLVKDGKQPKKIKYSSCIMIYDVDKNDYRTPEKDYYDADVKTYKYITDCIDLFTDLNDKVEIIEEPKKIEKISWREKESLAGELTANEKQNILARRTEKLKSSLNELIDEINKLKEND